VSTLQKVEAVGKKVDQVIKPTVYLRREALLTHADLLQPENGVTGSTTDPANFTVALTQTMQEALQAVTWDEVCVADTSNAQLILYCNIRPLGRLTGRDASTLSKMNANFLSPGYTSPSAKGIGKYPKQIPKSVEDSCSDCQYLEITTLEEAQGIWVILGNWWE